MFVHVPQTRAWVLDVLTSLHTFNDFEPGEFLTFLFLQCFLNGFCKHFVGGNRDIFQRVGALLGFLNVRCQPVGGVFNHGKLNGQLFHFVESGLCLIQRLGSSIIGVGRHTGGFIGFYQRNLRTHNAAGLDADRILHWNGMGDLIYHMNTQPDIGFLKSCIGCTEGGINLALNIRSLVD